MSLSQPHSNISAPLCHQQCPLSPALSPTPVPAAPWPCPCLSPWSGNSAVPWGGGRERCHPTWRVPPQDLCLPLCLEAAWGAASWAELPRHPCQPRGAYSSSQGRNCSCSEHAEGAQPCWGGSGSLLAGGPAGLGWQPRGEGIFSSPLPLAVGGVWHLFVVKLFGAGVAGGTELTRAQGTIVTPKSLDLGGSHGLAPLILSPGLCPGHREAARKLKCNRSTELLISCRYSTGELPGSQIMESGNELGWKGP